PVPPLPRRSRRHVERPRPLARLVQTRLDRVAVDAAVLHLELVGELDDLVKRVGRNKPQRDRRLAAAVAEPERARLVAAPVLLARVDLGELLVRGGHRPCMLERLALAFLPED